MYTAQTGLRRIPALPRQLTPGPTRRMRRNGPEAACRGTGSGALPPIGAQMGRRFRLTARQRRFAEHKVAGASDRQAALAAGFSLRVASHPREKLWRSAALRDYLEALLGTLPPERAIQELTPGWMTLRQRLEASRALLSIGEPMTTSG